MNSCLIVLLIVLVSGSACFAERFYATIFRPCPEIQCTDGLKETEMSKGSNCRCDLRCKDFGDCCADSEVAKNSTTPPAPLASSGNCLTYYGIPRGIHVVNTCPHSRDPMPFLRTSCKDGGKTLEQVSRPLIKVPITDLRDGTSYANFFCAACNGHGPEEMSNNFTFWPMQARCETVNETIQFPVKNMHKVLPEIDETKYAFKEHLRLWHKSVNGRLENCTLVPVPPSNGANGAHPATEFLRECDPESTNIVSTCSKTDHPSASKCPGYQALVKSLNNVYYRNRYCAECNGVDVSYIHCVGYPQKTIEIPEIESE